MDHYLRELDDLLSESVDCVRERERSAFDQILAECDGRLVLFGAGNFGRKVLACLRNHGIEPLAFTDNSPAKWGTRVDGLSVLRPNEAAEQHATSALFVVTIWSRGHCYSETHATLQALGCEHITCSSSLRWKFAEEMLPDYCQDLPHKVYEQAEEVGAAATLWADDYSRREYLNQVRWRTLGDLGALEPPVSEGSYFLDSLYELRPGEVFLDCGAYDGDTVRQFVIRNRGFKHVFAVEADPSNYRRLREWMETLDSSTSRRIDSFNVAVSAMPGKLRFDATGGEGARLSTNGCTTVDCARIDDLMTQDEPTFLKMDIEGAEMDALRGASRTIGHQPLLSICVYHRQSDLWRVPLFIRSLEPGYKFFLRPHEGDGRQLVSYAIPSHRLKL
jgi:FkbM family methyltransferase